MLSLATVVATLLRFRAQACVVLACLAAMLCTTSLASANTTAQTKTRVWDFSSALMLNVWLERSASPRTHLENRNGSSELASVSPHAARGGSTVDDFLPEAAKRLEAAKAKYGNSGAVMMARKADIKQVDKIVKDLKLNKDQRRILHDEITGQGLSIEEIREIAKEIAGSMPKGGGR